MPTFHYKARDRSGQLTSGQVQAEDSDELRRILRANDLYLTRFRGGGAAAKKPGEVAAPGVLDPKPKLQDMTIAMRQMATMLRAGVPIVSAIEIVGSQSGKATLRAAFKDIENGVMEGQTLSEGMRRHPKIFNSLVLSLVEAGEVAGTLDHTLEIAAIQLDREDELRKRVQGAIFYPKLVVGAAVGTIAVMLTVVVPVFSKVYGDLQAKLPAPTLILIAVSDVVCRLWWAVGLVALGLIYGVRKYRETATGKRNFDVMILKVPVFGPLARKIAIARFVQTLAGSLRGGVNVLRSLVIAGETAGNTVIRDAVISSALAVRDGSTIAEELTKSGEFPIMVTRMIAAGEESGNIDEMLDEINRFYDRDVQHSVDQMTRLIEPAMTIMIGSIVLLVLLALYMPIFKLGEAFQQAH